MLRIQIYAPGKVKETYLKDAINEFLKRLTKYAKVEIIETKEIKLQNKSKEEILKLEEDDILKRLDKNDYCVLLEIKGEEISSEEFASFIKKQEDFGNGKLVFIIGGTLGNGNGLKNRANKQISFSKLTFTHTLARFILLEQIYRAYKINKNESYHY